MNKRDAVLSLLDGTPPYIPAAFFLHFPPDRHVGQAAIDQHLDYFRATDMDIVKIQYERTFPRSPEIQRPEDWTKLPLYGADFYAEQLEVVRGLVKAAKDEAVVVITLYSPFMSAGHAVGDRVIADHIAQNPEAVKKGLEIATDSLMQFVKGCIDAGVDGFYHSTQGGENFRPYGVDTFNDVIRPYDLALMNEAADRCIFNILHVCDYHGPYTSYDAYVDYPGHIVNASLQLNDGQMTMQQIADLFGRPFMGGMDRHSALATATPAAIRSQTEAVLKDAPDRFFLAADCTVPSETPWENLRTAIDTAHGYR